MIIRPGAPIDLERFGQACLSFVDLRYVEGAPSAAQLEEAAAAFARHVYDNADDETLLRDALAYLLNLDDALFDERAWAAEPPFPQRDSAQLRALFELLWERTLANVRIEYFDPDDFELRV